ncbi:MAG: hypothetical protein DRH30_14305 [Deltaproteobacteria bacterium]|nr:MAG: hypothetical protein DRH30_14305 [Deltaproteobacteria bacterium]
MTNATMTQEVADSRKWLIEAAVENAKKVVLLFSDQMREAVEGDADVLSEFGWGGSAVHAMATLAVWKEMKPVLEHPFCEGEEVGDRMELALELAQKRMFHLARYPSSSTSELKNVADRARLTAWAEMVERLGGSPE